MIASYDSYSQVAIEVHRIHVFPGTYVNSDPEFSELIAFHPFEIVSVEGPEQTVITGLNRAGCVEIVDPGYVLIQGFTFTECGVPDSAIVNLLSAIYISSYFELDLHILDNVFERNGFGFSRSSYAIDFNPWFIDFENVNLRIERNVFRENYGGIRLDLNYFDREWFEAHSQLTIANNLIYDNIGVNGAEHHCASICLTWWANPNKEKVGVDIVNNTIINNWVGIEAVGASEAIHIENNIVYGNDEVVPQIRFGSTAPYFYPPAVIRNNLLSEHAEDPEIIAANNIYGSPAFYDQFAGDLRLQPNSDGIDLTNSNSRVALDTDFLGAERVVDGDYDGIAEIDAGAIEFR